MKRCMWWLCGLGVLLIALSPAFAQDKAAGGGEKPKREKKDGAKDGKAHGAAATDIAKDLNFTEAQKTKLATIQKKFDEDMAAWTKANGEKVKELQDQLAEIRKSGDKEKAKPIQDQLKPLLDAQKKIHDDKDAAVQALLTPGQKLAWESMTKYAKVSLTDDQKKQILALGEDAAKQLAGLKADEKGAEQIKADLAKKVEALLTTEQKDKLTAKKGEKGDKGEKTEKPGKTEKAVEGQK